MPPNKRNPRKTRRVNFIPGNVNTLRNGNRLTRRSTRTENRIRYDVPLRSGRVGSFSANIRNLWYPSTHVRNQRASSEERPSPPRGSYTRNNRNKYLENLRKRKLLFEENFIQDNLSHAAAAAAAPAAAAAAPAAAAAAAAAAAPAAAAPYVNTGFGSSAYGYGSGIPFAYASAPPPHTEAGEPNNGFEYNSNVTAALSAYGGPSGYNNSLPPGTEVAIRRRNASLINGRIIRLIFGTSYIVELEDGSEGVYDITEFA